MIHYKHFISEYPKLSKSMTLAVEIPSRLALFKLLDDHVNGYNTSISFGMGVARLHPKDQYDRRIGRAEAEKRMLLLSHQVKYIVLKRNEIEFTFSIPDSSNYFRFTIYNDSDKVRIY